MSKNTTFEAWLNGATVTERSVEIMLDGALLGRWDDWSRRYERAERGAAVNERSAGEVSPLRALEVEGAQLLEDIQAARATWFVRGLQEDVVKAVDAAFPAPAPSWGRFSVPPPVVPDNPTEAQADAFLKAVGLWEEQRTQFNEDNAEAMQAHLVLMREVKLSRGYERVARGTVRIEQGGEVLFTAVTADQARAFHQKLGDHEFMKIVGAIETATTTPADPPGEADFLLMVSAQTQP